MFIQKEASLLLGSEGEFGIRKHTNIFEMHAQLAVKTKSIYFNLLIQLSVWASSDPCFHDFTHKYIPYKVQSLSMKILRKTWKNIKVVEALLEKLKLGNIKILKKTSLQFFYLYYIQTFKLIFKQNL